MSLTCRSASGGAQEFRYRRKGLRYQRNVRIRTAWRIRSARARRGWTRSRNALASCSSRRNCARRRRRAASFPASGDGSWSCGDGVVGVIGPLTVGHAHTTLSELLAR